MTTHQAAHVAVLEALAEEMRGHVAEARSAIATAEQLTRQLPLTSDEHARMREQIVMGEARCALLSAWQSKLTVAIELMKKAGWIAVSERLPEPGVSVLLCIESRMSGKRKVIRADYAAPNTLELGCDQDWFEGCTEDEETGETFVPEGWYEHNEFDEVQWHVCDPVIAWQPLPAAPIEASR
jgi:hypothetical protein